MHTIEHVDNTTTSIMQKFIIVKMIKVMNNREEEELEYLYFTAETRDSLLVQCKKTIDR